MRIRHETFQGVFDLVYVGLLTNLLLAVGCLPLVAGLVMTDPSRSWPLLALVAPVCAPALCAAFGVLSAYSAGRSTAVLRTFAHVWRATAGKATAAGALATATTVVLGVDARAAWGRPVGAAAIPVLVVAMVLVASTALLAMVVLAERPTVRLRDALRACLYLAVRRWYLTVASLSVLAVLETLLAARPAVALGLAASPLLYVVWANSRYTLRAALEPGARPASRA
ncbi:hypothetical protein Raf01_31430 [Rugosimonospora africana]|uniref:Ferredoxin-NADPH reductase n=1 Tax=Rugosimonospora africana TaxID=556532 RepID=A0A8J3QR17_9ACTN|nr:hypothetical protein Raf01_31430 [Rugosimonospora africana]